MSNVLPLYSHEQKMGKEKGINNKFISDKLARHVAIDVDSTGHTGDMGRHSLNIQPDCCYPSAKSLETDAKLINFFNISFSRQPDASVPSWQAEHVSAACPEGLTVYSIALDLFKNNFFPINNKKSLSITA